MPRADWIAALRLAYPEPTPAEREDCARRFAEILARLAGAHA